MLPEAITNRVSTLLAVLLLILVPLVIVVKADQEVWAQGGFSIDRPTLRFIHQCASPTLDRMRVATTTLAGFLSLPFITLAVCANFWFRHHRRWAVFLPVAVVGSGALLLTIEALFRSVRPHLWISRAPETDAGSPSGHSITSIKFILVQVRLAWPTQYRWPALILGAVRTLLVGASGIYLYLGVHDPPDMVGTWAAGTLWTVIAYRVFFRFRHHAPEPGWRTL